MKFAIPKLALLRRFLAKVRTLLDKPTDVLYTSVPIWRPWRDFMILQHGESRTLNAEKDAPRSDGFANLLLGLGRASPFTRFPVIKYSAPDGRFADGPDTSSKRGDVESPAS
jgi:hypothetical protein